MTGKERQSNFELLRILAMLMIIGSHLAFHGIQNGGNGEIAFQIYNAGTLVNKIATCFLNPGGMIGVALFFMITGYFQINKKNASIKKVVLESVFYGWFAILLFIAIQIFGGDLDLEVSELLNFGLRAFFLPSTGGTWWFVSAYILLLLISPLLNGFLIKLNKKGFLITLLLVWALWYTIGYVADASFYDLFKGIFFYMVGAFFKLHCSKVSNNWNRFLYVISIIAAWCISAVIYYNLYTISIERSIMIQILNRVLLMCLVAFLVPLSAISLFRLFESLDIGFNRFINMFAGTTFGIYLIHDSLVGRNFIWHNLLRVDTVFYKRNDFPIVMLLIVLAVFIICSLIDLIRAKYIEPILMQKCKQIINLVKMKYT